MYIAQVKAKYGIIELENYFNNKISISKNSVFVKKVGYKYAVLLMQIRE